MRTIIVATACVVGACGCVAGRQATGTSRLAGVWEAVEVSGETLVIQSDGTFDFAGTMLGMAGDVSRLQRAGDSIGRPQEHGRLEITKSEFTPRTSYILLKSTHKRSDGRMESGYAQYHARLEPDGRLAVRSGKLPSAKSPVESLAVRRYRRIADAPPRRKPPPALKETKDEWIALGRRHFAGENWFEKLRVKRLSSGELVSVLLMPREEQLARRFLVVRVQAVSGAYAESALAGSAADSVKVGCSILSITIPELDPYGRPDATRVAELAQHVLSRTREAIELVQPDDCGLETYGNATYVGHYLWQTDNVPYDGWFCWKPRYFYWYGASAVASRNKPALLLVYSPFPNERELREHEKVVAKYKFHGFDNVRLERMMPRVPNWRQQSLRLLGQAVGLDLN